jgi:hypothetical protein
MTRRNSVVARRRSRVDWGWVVVATLSMGVAGAILVAVLYVMNLWLAT